MLSTTIVHVCARGGSDSIHRNGHAENGGQRAKCLVCGRTFILQPQGARYDQRFKDQVVGTLRRGSKAEGETCHVARWFGTLRARTSRLVRRTDSFSKAAENHLDAIHLFITNSNLAI